MPTVTDLDTYQQFALDQAQANNAFNAEQAQKQMDFQLMMSNTAHQREMADLKAAGLNPALAANSGASVTSGASASADTSASGNVGAILQQVLQAQSAREVAAMYNAATIASAQIAANASMYGYDVSAETSREYPNSFAGIVSRAIRQAQGVKSPVSAFQLAARKAVSSAPSHFSLAALRSSSGFGRLSQSMQRFISSRWNTFNQSQRDQIGRILFSSSSAESLLSRFFRTIVGKF